MFSAISVRLGLLQSMTTFLTTLLIHVKVIDPTLPVILLRDICIKREERAAIFSLSLEALFLDMFLMYHNVPHLASFV